MRAIAEDAKDPTLVNILFANKSVDDILLKEELDHYAKNPKVKVYYTVDKVISVTFPKAIKGPEGWKGFEGYVTKDMIKATMPAPGKDVIICFSGPKPMNKLLKKHLEEMGYSEGSIFKF
jgi:cytochrome-b5 reductase